MNLKDALAAGFPRSLFRQLDVESEGIVTPTQFKQFQKNQKREALQDALFGDGDCDEWTGQTKIT